MENQKLNSKIGEDSNLNKGGLEKSLDQYQLTTGDKIGMATVPLYIFKVAISNKSQGGNWNDTFKRKGLLAAEFGKNMVYSAVVPAYLILDMMSKYN